jgi:hypothetical protein
LVLPLVDPGEVAARVPQPHQEEPRRPPPGAVDVDQHLEEVHLGEIARPIRQRHEDLAALSLPLRDGGLDERGPDPMALADQQLVQPRGRELLFAARPVLRRRQQRFDARADLRPHRPGSRLGLPPHRLRPLDVLADCDPRDPDLLRDLSSGAAVDQHLMANDMYLVHLEHPLQRTRGAGSSAGPLSGLQVDQFPSGEWITF